MRLTLDMTKVLVCLTPWLCSLASMESELTFRAKRTVGGGTPAVTAARRFEMKPPCHETLCPLPPDTVPRVIRFSYVPEILRAADDL